MPIIVELVSGPKHRFCRFAACAAGRRAANMHFERARARTAKCMACQPGAQAAGRSGVKAKFSRVGGLESDTPELDSEGFPAEA
jgi:hypothetical protein